ncbi:MAG: site-2 protease family protein [Dehalococcoidia bacterium]
MDALTESILPFAGILIGLIVIHEAGHYFTAKLFGIKVLEAGLGYPPRVWGFKWRETEYTINALPLGGFVRLLGEENPEDPDSLAARPKWQRTIVLASGAFMNFVLAIALFSVALMIPRDVSAGGATIADVLPDSPAAAAGLQPGDEIVEINGREAKNREDASYLVRLYQGSDIDFLVKRTVDPRIGPELVEVKDVYARWNPPANVDDCGVTLGKQGPTGISLSTRYGQSVPLSAADRAELEGGLRKGLQEYRSKLPPGSPARCSDGTAFGFVPIRALVCDDYDAERQAAARALKVELFPNAEAPCYEFDPPPDFVPFVVTRSEPPWEAIPDGTRLSFESLVIARNQVWSWIRGYASPEFAGPVGIAQATGQVVEEAGWKSLVDFAALLSMNLAILNILPIPMFDGGRLFFILIEFLRGGRRIAPQKEAIVHLVGLAMILTFAGVITYFDIVRLIDGGSLLR